MSQLTRYPVVSHIQQIVLKMRAKQVLSKTKATLKFNFPIGAATIWMENPDL